MAEACEIPTGSYTLKLGSTFSIHANDTSYHTLRCKLYIFFSPRGSKI